MYKPLHLPLIATLSAALFVSACSGPDMPAGSVKESAAEGVVLSSVPSGSCDQYDENGTALFGDLHVHTSFSFDAAAISTGATPQDAHNYARGGEIPFFPVNAEGEATGRIKIDRPLDFLAVTDHGEFLGERALCSTEGSPVYNTEFCVGYRSDQRLGMMMLGTVITTETPARIPEICGADVSLCRDFAQSPWETIQATSNANN